MVLPKLKINIYKELYKNLPEATLSQKIRKIRKMNNLEKSELASMLNLHLDTIIAWECNKVLPSPLNIKNICLIFKLPINYFGEYYKLYWNVPGKKLKTYKTAHNLTYDNLANILNISRSGCIRLVNGKINLSYDMYIIFKKIGVL